MKLIEAHISSLIFTNIGFSIFLKTKEEGFSDIVLPIFIGPLETHSITNILQKKKVLRPMTHDLLFSILNKCSISVTKVVIDRVVDNTFYSVVFLKKESEKEAILVDSRTSDAIAIAIRTMSPIYVDEGIFKELGISLKDENWLKDITYIHQQDEKTSSENTLSELQQRLDQAVKERNYELAAELRDKINKISSK